MDYNATTPVDPAVMGAFDRMCRRDWANPSSLHTAGIKAWEEIEQCRGNIGDYFQCDPAGIRFCSSGSEALHAGLFGVLARRPVRTLITTKTEHAAIKHPARIFRLSGGRVVQLDVDSGGVLDRDQLVRELRENGRALLVISPVNHETGARQPVKEIAALARSAGCLVFFDAVQAAARMTRNEWAPHCDMWAVSGHKLCAPKGTALLWLRKGIRLLLFRRGGYQEAGLFPGTVNAPGIGALSAAVDLLRSDHAAELRRLKTLAEEGLAILGKAGFSIELESPPNAAPGVLCFSLPRVDNIEELLFHLARNHICVSRFSACSSRVSGPSQILRAMGRSRRRASTSIRLSLGRWSKRDDFFRLAASIKSYRAGHR